MKAFYISSFLFIVMILLIVCNSAYINYTANELIKKAYELPPPEDTKYYICIKDLEDVWMRNYSLVSLSVGLNDLNRISDNITQLTAYSLNKNQQDFEATRMLLINAIKNLHRLEQISLDSIM